MAWSELGSIQAMYPTPGQLLWDYNKVLYALVEAAKLSVGQLYAQTNQQAGTDSFQGPAISKLSFADEAMTQHDHNVYLQHVTPSS